LILLKILLFPFSILFYLIIVLRNFFYDVGLLPQTSFDIPTIGVGNLSFGGTGKTPLSEYIIKLLKDNYKVALLSRGYKRLSSGYVYAEEDTHSKYVGDEPSQIKQKFGDDVAVAVCENRVLGLPNLLWDAPDTNVVVLDDVFQHRAIKPGLNLLLTQYNKLFTSDYMAPSGTLREYRSAYKRADAIIVTKCPADISQTERELIISKINPIMNQRVFFSFQRQLELKNIVTDEVFEGNESETTALFFAGIASIKGIEKYLKGKFKNIVSEKFWDHYRYSRSDVNELILEFNEIKSTPKIFITTEKDKVKLVQPELYEILKDMPVYYLPLEFDFFELDKEVFDNMILEYVMGQINAGEGASN